MIFYLFAKDIKEDEYTNDVIDFIREQMNEKDKFKFQDDEKETYQSPDKLDKDMN